MQPWVTNEILDICDKRRSLKETKTASEHDRKEYKKVNSSIWKKIKTNREEWIIDQSKQIYKAFMIGLTAG